MDCGSTNCGSPNERAAYLALLADAHAGLGGERPDLRRRLHARLTAEAAYDGSGSVGAVQELIDDARAAGDKRALAEASGFLHHAMMTPRYVHDRLPVADELLTVASSIDDRTLVVMGMCWRTVDLFMLGHTEAERALADLRLRAEQFDVLAVRYVVAAIDTMLLMRAGRLADAEAMAFACHGLGTETGDADADGWYLAQVFAVRWMQGRAGELLDALEEIERSTTTVPVYAGYISAIAAVLATEAGDAVRARAALDRVFASELSSLPESSAWLPILFCLAEAAAFLDDSDAAAEIARALEPYGALPVMGSLAVVCFGSASRALGLARGTAGDLDAAIAALDGAILHNRRLGHLPMLAITRADLASALLARGAAGDAARARQLLAVAIEAGTAIGLGARVEQWQVRHRALLESPAAEGFLRQRAGHWEVDAGAEHAVVPDGVGMRYLATLLARPRDEVRAAQLAGAVEEHGVQEVLDDRARVAYRRQLGELHRDIDEAEADADIERAARLRSELDALVDELERVIRPGGRSRTFAGSDERARTSVQKALRRAIANLASEAPVLADALTRSIHTGTVCRFDPVAGVPERWRVHAELGQRAQRPRKSFASARARAHTRRRS